MNDNDKKKEGYNLRRRVDLVSGIALIVGTMIGKICQVQLFLFLPCFYNVLGGFCPNGLD